MVDTGVTVWFNPQCSKCRGADALLGPHGVPVHKIHYLDDPPAARSWYVCSGCSTPRIRAR